MALGDWKCVHWRGAMGQSAGGPAFLTPNFVRGQGSYTVGGSLQDAKFTEDAPHVLVSLHVAVELTALQRSLDPALMLAVEQNLKAQVLTIQHDGKERTYPLSVLPSGSLMVAGAVAVASDSTATAETEYGSGTVRFMAASPIRPELVWLPKKSAAFGLLHDGSVAYAATGEAAISLFTIFEQRG